MRVRARFPKARAEGVPANGLDAAGPLRTVGGVGSHNALEAAVRATLFLSAFQVYVAVRHQTRQRARTARRPVPGAIVATFAVWFTLLGLVLWFYFSIGGWTLKSVGFSGATPPAAAFIAGFGGYLVFLFIVRGILRLSHSQLLFMRAALRANGKILPSQTWERRLTITLLVLVNPFVEELLFRGLLVHQMALLMAPLWLALVVGAMVNAANHAYQGWLLVPFHLAFYAVAVGTLYSPLGMAGCIGLHFAGDLLPILLYRRSLAAYRAARRAAVPRTARKLASA